LENATSDQKIKKSRSNPPAATTTHVSDTQDEEEIAFEESTFAATQGEGEDVLSILASTVPLPSSPPEATSKSDASSEVSETTRKAAERIVQLKGNKPQKPKRQKKTPKKERKKSPKKERKKRQKTPQRKPPRKYLKQGTRIEVFWSKEDTQNETEGFFRGVVRRYEKDKIIILYDDAEESVAEDEDFGGNKWRILDDED